MSLKILFRRHKESDKYFTLIEQLELSKEREIEPSLEKLNELKKYINTLSYSNLKIMKAQIDTIVDDYKQNSLLTAIVSTMVTLFILIINFIKEGPFKTLSEQVAPFATLFFILFIGLLMLVFIAMIGDYTDRAKKLQQLANIVELVITERDEINNLHNEAYKEFYMFLKEDGAIT